MGKTIFYSEHLRERIEREMERRIRVCCRLLVTHAKDLISTDGTGRRASGRTVKRGGVVRKFRKGSLIYGANPSKPGEPPHVQTGRLRSSVAYEIVSATVGRVGTNVKYGRWLELGTRRVAARPWLRRALAEKQDEIRAILTAPMNFRRS
jgi:hypothetical protein